MPLKDTGEQSYHSAPMQRQRDEQEKSGGSRRAHAIGCVVNVLL
jgi:hypothetical protein